MELEKGDRHTYIYDVVSYLYMDYTIFGMKTCTYIYGVSLDISIQSN